MTARCGLTLLSDAQELCPNMHQEGGKSCPSIWPRGGRIPRERASEPPLCLTIVFFPLNGAFTGCLEEMLLVLFSTPIPIPSNQGKRSLVLKQSG